jgi:hypothetical protein
MARLNHSFNLQFESMIPSYQHQQYWLIFFLLESLILREIGSIYKFLRKQSVDLLIIIGGIPSK